MVALRKQNHLKLDPNFLAVLPTLPQMCSVSCREPKLVELSNGTVQTQVKGTGDAAASVEHVTLEKAASAERSSALSEQSTLGEVNV